MNNMALDFTAEKEKCQSMAHFCKFLGSIEFVQSIFASHLGSIEFVQSILVSREKKNCAVILCFESIEASRILT